MSIGRNFPLRAWTLILAAGALLTQGCSFQSDADNRALIERYFTQLGAHDLDGALALYSQGFFATTPRRDWRRVLEDMSARCGAPRTHALTTWSQSTNFGTDSGSRSVLVYEVGYDRCRVVERFTVLRPRNGAAQIVSHDIRVNGRSDSGAQSV
jgi:hypothetical protein